MTTRTLSFILFLFIGLSLSAQDNVYPAKKQERTIIIKNGTIYTAAGAVISNGTLVIKEGKIASVGTNAVEEAGATVLDATGKHIYPGLILPHSDLGIAEISSGVRGSNDYYELGEYNPSVRSVVAYNTDSKIINTLRSNGILLAGVVPQGRLITGMSSVVQLDAWTWQDAVYKSDYGLHLNMPALMRSSRGPSASAPASDPVKTGLATVEEVQQFFRQAQAYLKDTRRGDINLKMEALRPLFEKKQKLFIRANTVRQMLVGVDFVKQFDINLVIVGGADSYLIADILKQNNIAVILNTLHSLPTLQDDDLDQPFKTPALLQKAGVLFAINDNSDNARYRNLAFNAGTAAAYGLTKEQALAAITLNPAKILGIDQQTGSIEPGKDANIIICEGDLLDMRSGIVTGAFIQGRRIDLNNKQTQLYERYLHRYNLR